MQGVREGSWGKRFWQPGTVDFYAEASPTGNRAKPEGLPGFWGQEGTCQGYPAGEGTQGTRGEGSSGLTHTLNFERCQMRQGGDRGGNLYSGRGKSLSYTFSWKKTPEKSLFKDTCACQSLSAEGSDTRTHTRAHTHTHP